MILLMFTLLLGGLGWRAVGDTQRSLASEGWPVAEGVVIAVLEPGLHASVLFVIGIGMVFLPLPPWLLWRSFERPAVDPLRPNARDGR